MKKLLVALAFVSTAVFGQSNEWVARVRNEGGGQIVLLNLKGICQTGMMMYSAISNGTMTWGCWFTTDTHIMVLWDEGEIRTSAFEYGIWEVNPSISKKPPVRHSM